MLTAPTAARPSVHLLNFICSSDVVLFVVVNCVKRGKNSLPQHLEDAFEVKSRETLDNCNHFFDCLPLPVVIFFENGTVLRFRPRILDMPSWDKSCVLKGFEMIAPAVPPLE
jgi:hypothetical protein